jgi:NADPH:quinone reductase-like Zn-dependent oxidoreductase
MDAMALRAPGGLDHLELKAIPDPAQPGPGEILVAIRASSLNFHDLGVVAGWIPTADGRIPLSDGAGEVIAVGDGVGEYRVGDHVLSTFFRNWPSGRPPINFAQVPGDGCDGYARGAVVAPASAFTLAPEGYSHTEAATLTCAGLTAWRALFRDGGLCPGETVLVQGTGGVSIFALQFAKMAGARVIATTSSPDKQDRLRALGADLVIDSRAMPEWSAAVLDATGGVGVDHVIEVGGAASWDQSIASTRFGGHVAVIGALSGLEGGASPAAILFRQIRLQGLIVGSREDQVAMIAAIDATKVRPVIDRHFPLSELADAFRHLQGGRHVGKIVIDI